MQKKIRLVKDSKFGYYYYPYYKNNLDGFYKDKYFEGLQKESRTSESKLLRKNTVRAKKELSWLKKTYYQDICTQLKIFSKGNKLIDIGCGTGEFLEFMSKNDWDVTGIEQSKLAHRRAVSKNINIFNTTLENFVKMNCLAKFDVVTLSNVLEHIPDPVRVLKMTISLLSEKGILYLSVPNDFNILQTIANDYVKNKEWWVKLPDHQNYFGFQSLEKLLMAANFDILEKTTDFPMELFLLMGDNYIDDSRIGKVCHQKRMLLEERLTAVARHDVYRQLAKINIGRQCIIYAKKR